MTKAFCTVKVNKDDAEIEVYEVKELTGSASVTIRKSKQTPMFEFEGELYWRAKRNAIDDRRSTCQGKMKVHEFSAEDDELSIDVTCGTEGPWADSVRRIVQRDVSERLL